MSRRPVSAKNFQSKEKTTNSRIRPQSAIVRGSRTRHISQDVNVFTIKKRPPSAKIQPNSSVPKQAPGRPSSAPVRKEKRSGGHVYNMSFGTNFPNIVPTVNVLNMPLDFDNLTIPELRSRYSTVLADNLRIKEQNERLMEVINELSSEVPVNFNKTITDQMHQIEVLQASNVILLKSFSSMKSVVGRKDGELKDVKKDLDLSKAVCIELQKEILALKNSPEAAYVKKKLSELQARVCRSVGLIRDEVRAEEDIFEGIHKRMEPLINSVLSVERKCDDLARERQEALKYINSMRETIKTFKESFKQMQSERINEKEEISRREQDLLRREKKRDDDERQRKEREENKEREKEREAQQKAETEAKKFPGAKSSDIEKERMRGELKLLKEAIARYFIDFGVLRECDRKRKREPEIKEFLSRLCMMDYPVKADDEDRSTEPYRYKEYSEILSRLVSLSSNEGECPGLITLFDAESSFSIPSATLPLCGQSACKFFFVKVTAPGNSKIIENSRPQVFISGALHGNEKLGPNVVLTLLDKLCALYSGSKSDNPIVWLLESVSLIAIPMANPQGYFLNLREEDGKDPNRDFPYNTKQCLRSVSSLVVFEIFQRNLIQIAITFHGGTRAIAYPWGSFNHVKDGASEILKGDKKHSTNPPDLFVFQDIAKVLQMSAGKKSPHSSEWFYDVGSSTDTLYAVNGGMEDWAYGSGFEQSPSPVTLDCDKRTIKTIGKENVKSIIFLVETSDEHTPPSGSLGSDTDSGSVDIEESFSAEGHIPRNLRVSLRLMEFASPSIYWLKPPTVYVEEVSKAWRVSGSLIGVGCIEMHNIALIGFINESCSLGDDASVFVIPLNRQEKIPCTGLFSYEREKNKEFSFDEEIGLFDNFFTSGDADRLCLKIETEFDQSWKNRKVPDADPPSTNGFPVSHLALARISESYSFKNELSDIKIETKNKKIFTTKPVINLPFSYKLYKRIQAKEVDLSSSVNPARFPFPDSYSLAIIVSIIIIFLLIKEYTRRRSIMFTDASYKVSIANDVISLEEGGGVSLQNETNKIQLE